MNKRDWSDEPLTPRETLVWNAAVTECQGWVYSDGIELHPELVQLLEKAKR
jgi:hypothetical protein